MILNACGLENHLKYEVRGAKIIKVVFFFFF